jgi:hypothetical protein
VRADAVARPCSFESNDYKELEIVVCSDRENSGRPAEAEHHDGREPDPRKHEHDAAGQVIARRLLTILARSGNKNPPRDVSVALPEGHLAGEEGIVRRRLHVAVGVEGP